MTGDQVYVTGGAMIPMGRYPGSSYAGLAVPAVLAALRDARVGREKVEEVYCGHTFGGMLTGQRIVKELGIGGVPVTNVDNACSSGASALHHAYRSVRSGVSDVVLVIGVEKLTQFGGGTLPLIEDDPEVRAGMVMPALYAMRAQRYLHEREATAESLAAVSVKARRHGARNPYAQYRKEVTVPEVLGARRRVAAPALRIRASVLHSGRMDLGARDMLHPQISVDSANDAYAAAGVTPQDLDVVELHDAFSIAELVYYEALGLCAPGDSAKLLGSGGTTYGGRTVVNPSGGLLAKGHPVGASGAAQVVEMLWQLTGRAGGRQVDGARIGLTHVTGGGISGLDHGACTVHIFEGVG
jgi:acetyl-CoA acetyltransferase